MIITNSLVILALLRGVLGFAGELTSSSEEEESLEDIMTPTNTRISRNTNNGSLGFMFGAGHMSRSNVIASSAPSQQGEERVVQASEELDNDSQSVDVQSVEEPVELVAFRRPARGIANPTKKDNLKGQVEDLCMLPRQLEVMAELVQTHGSYLQGSNGPRAKRQDLLGNSIGGTGGLLGGTGGLIGGTGGLIGGGDSGLLGGLVGGEGGLLGTGGDGGLLGTGGAGGLLGTGGAGNGLGTGVAGGLLGGTLENLLGPNGAVPDVLQALLGNQHGNGLLGGLLNSVAGSVLGQNILSQLLGAVTTLIHELLNLLRGLLGLPTLPSLPPIGGSTSVISIPRRIQVLLNVLSQFQQFAGNINNFGNMTGTTPTANASQICFAVDGFGHPTPSNSLINISPKIILDVNILSRIFRSGATSFPGNRVRQICVTTDGSENITQIVVDNITFQRSNRGLFSIINLSPTLLLNLNVLSQVLEFLNPRSIPSSGVGGAGNANVICFNVESGGNFIPSNNIGQSSLIDISPTLLANLNILSNVIQSRGTTFTGGHTHRMCVRPSANGGDISQMVVNGSPVPINPRRPFSLLNLDFDLDLNLNILSNILQLLNPGFGGGSAEICIDIPIHSGSGNSGLINISPTIGISANILSTILGGRPPSHGATKRICIPVPNPTTTARPVTPTPTRPPTPTPTPTRPPTPTPTPTRPPTPTPTPGPIKRCYKKTCKRFRHSSGSYRCHSKRNTDQVYKVVYSH